MCIQSQQSKILHPRWGGKQKLAGQSPLTVPSPKHSAVFGPWQSSQGKVTSGTELCWGRGSGQCPEEQVCIGVFKAELHHLVVPWYTPAFPTHLEAIKSRIEVLDPLPRYAPPVKVAKSLQRTWAQKKWNGNTRNTRIVKEMPKTRGSRINGPKRTGM